MAKRKPAEKEPIVVRDELLAPPPGADYYELVLSEDDVEKLMAGRVSHDLMESAFRMLSWKREGQQAWDLYEDPCPHCGQLRDRKHD